MKDHDNNLRKKLNGKLHLGKSNHESFSQKDKNHTYKRQETINQEVIKQQLNLVHQEVAHQNSGIVPKISSSITNFKQLNSLKESGGSEIEMRGRSMDPARNKNEKKESFSFSKIPFLGKHSLAVSNPSLFNLENQNQVISL